MKSRFFLHFDVSLFGGYSAIWIFLSFQSKDYAEPDYEALCQHLGHSFKVHQRWYRMRDPTIALAKVEKMLTEHE